MSLIHESRSDDVAWDVALRAEWPLAAPRARARSYDDMVADASSEYDHFMSGLSHEHHSHEGGSMGRGTGSDGEDVGCGEVPGVGVSHLSPCVRALSYRDIVGRVSRVYESVTRSFSWVTRSPHTPHDPVLGVDASSAQGAILEVRNVTKGKLHLSFDQSFESHANVTFSGGLRADLWLGGDVESSPTTTSPPSSVHTSVSSVPGAHFDHLTLELQLSLAPPLSLVHVNDSILEFFESGSASSRPTVFYHNVCDVPITVPEGVCPTFGHALPGLLDQFWRSVFVPYFESVFLHFGQVGSNMGKQDSDLNMINTTTSGQVGSTMGKQDADLNMIDTTTSAQEVTYVARASTGSVHRQLAGAAPAPDGCGGEALGIEPQLRAQSSGTGGTFVRISDLFGVLARILWHLGLAVVTVILLFSSRGRATARAIIDAVHTHSVRFIVLTVVLGAEGAATVCPRCFGNIAGCDYVTMPDPKSCIADRRVVTNTAVLAGTAGAAVVLSLTNLIKPRFLRAFATSAFEAIVTLHRRPSPGTPFSFDKDTAVNRVMHAVSSGGITIDLAILRYAELLDAETDEAEAKKLERKLNILTKTKDVQSFQRGTGSSADGGVYSYLYAKVMGLVKSRGMETKVVLNTGAAPSASQSIYTATIERPTEAWEFFEALNLMTMFVTALGLCLTPLFCDFLESAVFDTIRALGRQWQYAQELMLVMFRRVEDSGGTLDLCQVCDSPHLASMHAEADRNLQHFYPKAEFFRPPGGNPGAQRGDKLNQDGKPKYNGKCDPTGRTCSAWNEGKDHAAHMLKPDGTCRFAHVCDMWVTGKGPKGRCMGEKGTPGHSRLKCDNPDRCDAPVK